MNKKDIKFYTPITKVDDEQRMVYGYCTTESLDSQGEVVSKMAIRKAWEGYMEYANVREMHQPSAVGITKEYSHDDLGTQIGVKVIDDRAWKFVKEGVYKGFSIGGRVVKKSKNIIEEIVLAEISLVDRPANPDAKFTAVKVDGGLVDDLHLQAINKTNMNKFIEIDGVKYVEDEANPGKAKIGEDGEPVPFVEEEEKAEEVVEETPAEEVKEEVIEEKKEEAPVEEKKEEVVEETPAVEAKEDEAGKSATVETKKDTMGVITLAGVLDHLDFISAMFEMNGKPTDAIKSIIEECKKMIATEASEADKAQKTVDLFKSALGPAVEKMLGGLSEEIKNVVKSVEDISKDLETIKNTKVSARPKATAMVDKNFDNGDGASDKSLAQKREALEAVKKEVEDFSVTMKSEISQDPGRAPQLQKQSNDLFTKLRNAQRAVSEHTE